MTAGQSCYFKVDGIPIRVAWIRRSLDDISKTQKYIAVLFVSVNEKAPNKLEGTTLTWFNENPAMLEAWFTYAGFNERLCIRIVCYGRSYKFLHNSPAVRGAYEKKIGKEDRKDEDKFIYKVADAIDSRFIQFSIDENERIEDILQDLVPISKNLYAVGENLRSYGIRPMRLDFDNKEDKRHGSFRV
ncbi:hypothetical protein LY78DRAFT_591831 [Colletotrichum sublineola]|nr:hypothetical protein LY78DRAFT_591831 [Colletotrichum sublineola]